MVTTITDGVKVSVETQYQPEYSNPASDHYMFAYKINIENVGENTVQLLRRRWDIFDSNGEHREVEGEGVVGEQPVIEPGSSHEYISGCNLKTDMGTMKGEYQMIRTVDNTLFDVQIPQFDMVAPYRMN
ncbi:Co2+/Mg2+ efflux protein ApaG [Mucilaginibacter polytrichastri]|uniref:Protein ApaG n=1 Tax=Mucilaginibacter polytrichastri TaxID=1302689 RepID=A0A1Q6A4L2_9SPHI|nr:Co2+/Mg2+ efflux protein ApaG [Mucilaginibacter polytrichastri]OKS88954.1 Protein ApaG [Mucilaginibacter polytrichastri]SFT25509.1 ApaG protein [Mucilaginibacter polytrichastri]